MDSKKTFVNEFLTIGMADYLEGGNTSFEKHIIDCLADIYGEDDLKVAYYNGEDAFYNLIMKYGLKPTVYENFLRDTVKYESFRKEYEQNMAIKSDLASILEIDIITMFLQKSLVETPSLETVSHFENDLLNDFTIIKLHFNTSLNPNKTREYWAKKKKLLNSNVELFEVVPNYLDESIYKKFGVNIDDVKKMDYRMVEELNNYIKVNSENNVQQSSGNKVPLWNTAISSGSGFVDGILFLSIVVTEISIILIFALSRI